MEPPKIWNDSHLIYGKVYQSLLILKSLSNLLIKVNLKFRPGVLTYQQSSYTHTYINLYLNLNRYILTAVQFTSRTPKARCPMQHWRLTTNTALFTIPLRWTGQKVWQLRPRPLLNLWWQEATCRAADMIPRPWTWDRIWPN